MTSTTYNNGRFGNQIIRNLAVSFIAKKNNLKVNYANNDAINRLGIKLFSGNNIYSTTRKLTEDNYFDIYNTQIDYNLDGNEAFFQTKMISNMIYDYINSDDIKSNIILKNQFKERYNNNNDIFIHIRLGDMAHNNPGLNYYLNTIKLIKEKNDYNDIYISSDEIDHDIIKKIKEEYPNANLINCDEITTFQFGSTCKNIILSHASFSAIIGYLSFYSNVYYHKYEENKIWYGDMFSINNWIELQQ
jgi:hypothetical protein